MKRIGIITFHRSINYGAYMQCLSLSHFLSKKFPDCKVDVIDYESEKMRNIYISKFSLVYIKHPIIYRLNKKMYAEFKSSLKFLPLSERYFCSDGIDSELESYILENYDVIIVGSDAVWNWVKRGFPNPYLLNFGKNIKKLSYAASAYGMEMNYIGESEAEYLNNSFKDFYFIGYRDDYTRSIVNKVCPEAEPQFTCDPTCFLDLDYVLELLGHTKETFKDYIYKKYNIPKNKIIIGAMETTNTVVKAIKEKYKNECYVICLYNYLKSADKFIAGISPLEWSLMFSLFDVTVTNYFHGTLLSLKNNTPIISIDRTGFSKKYEGKIHDVLRRMDLLDCFFDGYSDTDDIVSKFDYVLKNKDKYKEKIKTNLEILSKTNIDFENALKEVLCED